MRPEEALAAARERNASLGPWELPPGGLEVERSDEPSDDELLQWSVVEPDLREVRSTRRYGAPVTQVKQLLLRLLGQYNAQVLSVQNRVNVHLALRSSVTRDEVKELRAELATLRARVAELEGGPADDAGDPAANGAGRADA